MIALPSDVALSPQELRVFAALQEWADASALRRAIDEPDGVRRYSPPAIILAKMRAKLAQTSLTIECNKHPYDRTPDRRWRLVDHVRAEAA